MPSPTYDLHLDLSSTEHTTVTVTIYANTNMYSIISTQKIKLPPITLENLNNITSKDGALALLADKTHHSQVKEFLEANGIINPNETVVTNIHKIKNVLESIDFKYYFCHRIMQHENEHGRYDNAACWELARDNFRLSYKCWEAITHSFNRFCGRLQLFGRAESARNITSPFLAAPENPDPIDMGPSTPNPHI